MKEEKLLVYCTQNEAMRALRALRCCGILGCITRPTRQPHRRSCSWAVKISARDIARAERCLHRESLRWEWMDGQ